MKKKRWIAVLMIFALLLPVIGCQTAKKEEPGESIANEKTDTSPEKEITNMPPEYDITNKPEKNNVAITPVEKDITKTPEKSSDSVTPIQKTEASAYYGKLFDNSYVHLINVQITENDWTDLKTNPLDKTKYKVDVTIDGEKLSEVSFATKGNTSLSSIANDKDCDRYSFKLNFGKFVKNQTYYGLDKLNLNNLYADATYMKDYLSYEIFRAAGLEVCKTSYVLLQINGEDFGLYLAIEEIGDSFLDRTEDGDGELYKPESEMLANVGNFGNRSKQEGVESPQMPNGSDSPQKPDWSKFPQMGDGANGENGWGRFNDFVGFKGFGNSGKGSSLVYSDDELTSYSDIFDNAETKVSEEDNKRVIAAIKKLSEGTSLEECLDTEKVIKYFVAHNFVLNYDSYTGTMLHNYYLYEKDGKLSMLPWDYNLAYGAFSMGGMGQTNFGGSKNQGATSVINCGIDSPLSGAQNEDRPMWNWIVSNDEYLQKYHECFSDLITDFFESGKCLAETERVYNLILPYVEKDSSAFYSSDEFMAAYESLKLFCTLRAESIKKQLAGDLSKNTDEQEAKDQINADQLKISTMGSQNMGGFNRDGFGDMWNKGQGGFPFEN